MIRKVGFVLTSVGVVWLIAAMNMDTSVLTPVRTNEYGMWDGQLPTRVENIGLIARRENHIMLGGLFTLIGILLILFGGKGGWKNNDDASETTAAAAPPAALDLDDDEYRLWLAERYSIVRNDLFDAYVVQKKTFPNLEAALAHAHELEVEEEQRRRRAAEIAAEEEELRRLNRAENWGLQKNLARVVAIGIAVIATGAVLFLLPHGESSDKKQSTPQIDTTGSQSANETLVKPTTPKNALEADPASVAASTPPPVENNECSGFYAHLDTNASPPNGLSVEVRSRLIEVQFSDYVQITAQKLPSSGGSTLFSENRSDAGWTLQCSGENAVLTIPADEWNDQRTYKLQKSDGDIFQYALSQGYDLRH